MSDDIIPPLIFQGWLDYCRIVVVILDLVFHEKNNFLLFFLVKLLLLLLTSSILLLQCLNCGSRLHRIPEVGKLVWRVISQKYLHVLPTYFHLRIFFKINVKITNEMYKLNLIVSWIASNFFLSLKKVRNKALIYERYLDVQNMHHISFFCWNWSGRYITKIYKTFFFVSVHLRKNSEGVGNLVNWIWIWVFVTLLKSSLEPRRGRNQGMHKSIG